MTKSSHEFIQNLLEDEIEHHSNRVSKHCANKTSINIHTPESQRDDLIKYENTRIAFHMSVANAASDALKELGKVIKS